MAIRYNAIYDAIKKRIYQQLVSYTKIENVDYINRIRDALE